MFSFVACGNGNGGGNPYFGTKAPTAAKEVGDIVFSDGSTTASKYPAFYFGKNYKNQTGSHVAGTSYETGWCLPSIAELFQIYANGKGENKVFDVDAASTLCGGDIFGSSYYWSSTQYALYSNIAAYRFNFSDVACSSYGKDGISYVCAIREF